MKSQKITFENNEGIQLSARLEFPVDKHPLGYAIFAHCFTCSKNLNAVKHISRSLTSNGIAVMRFDFTGLGESQGDFADTSFSSNVDDLVAAIRFLEENYELPKILVGHSLGGAAVLFAASRVPEIEAIVTVGAPSDPEHVQHLFAETIEEIQEKGQAEVNLGGRPFTIKKKFIDDLKNRSATEVIKGLRRPLLVMHSPQDTTVGIENASNIYTAAHHPKSFISLDGADHLLTSKEDSIYVGDVIASWAKRYIKVPEETALRSKLDVVASTNNEEFTTQIKAGKHKLTADEPTNVGGNDFGPTPYGYLLAALGSCTTMTLQMYAKRKGWPLEEAVVHLKYAKDYLEDMEEAERPDRKMDHIDRLLELKGPLNDEQKARLIEIADKCPVHKTLHAPVVVHTTLAE